MQEENKDLVRTEHLRERRREFLRQTLVTSAYVAPVVLSFAAKDLARAASGEQLITDPGEGEDNGKPRVEDPGGATGGEGPGGGNETET